MGNGAVAQEAGQMPWLLFAALDSDSSFSTQLRTCGGRVPGFPGVLTKCTKGSCFCGGQRMGSRKILSLLLELLMGRRTWGLVIYTALLETVMR